MGDYLNMSYLTKDSRLPVVSKSAAMIERDEIISYLLQASDAKNKTIEDQHKQITDLQEQLVKNASSPAVAVHRSQSSRA